MDSRCSACPAAHKVVDDSGPEDAELLMVGEAPGYQENENNCPFVGKTGIEVNDHYLPLAGLRRSKIPFTNAIRCLPTSSKGKLDIHKRTDMEMLESCAQCHLYPKIERMKNLKVIIPMGAFACYALDPTIKLDLHHGIPRECSGYTLFPMLHPAGGIHEPKKMLQIRTDWIRLRRFLKGTLVHRVDSFPNPDYKEATTGDIKYIDPTIPMANDTETSRSEGPYFYTFSQHGGVGRLIRAGNRDHLELLQRVLSHWESILIWHNWLYDYHVVTRMGLEFPMKKIRDSMVTAFHLGNLPQGLKALSLRELGMEMQDFEDLVTPYSAERVMEYYEMANMIDWPKPEAELVRKEGGAYKKYQAQGMNTKFKRFFTDYKKNPDKDIFRMWTENWASYQDMIEEKLGPWPGLDIAHVPFDKALYYACRDADATIRIWPVLQQMIQQVRKTGQENWRENGS